MFTVHAQKRLFMSFRSKIWPCHSLRRPRFPIRRVYFHYRMTFAAYIWCFCAQFSFDLVTLTCDLLALVVSNELSFIHPTHVAYQFLASYDYPFLSYGWLNMITLPSHGTVTARAPCHVTCHRGEWFTFLKSLTPICLFTLSLSGRYDED